MDLKTIQETISKLNLPESDIYVFCDGAGTTVKNPCGWASVIYFPFNSTFEILTGSFSRGTNNLAELMPIAQSLWFIRYTAPNAKFFITFVSDSELTVKQAIGEYIIEKNNPTKMFWKSIQQVIGEVGYQTTWIHVPRNSNPLNELCDSLAKKAKLTNLDLTKEI